MHRSSWTSCLAALAPLAAAAPQAGTYDVVSCGAPGANGVNRAWQPAPGSRPGIYRIRARIRREDTIPYDLGYARPVRVIVR